MLSVARAQPQPTGGQIEWQQGDATRLPFPDGEFGAVLCQQGLQDMPDRPAALREMKRVLASGGTLGLGVFSESVGYQIFERTAAQFVGEKAAAIMREAFALADLGELSALLRMAEVSTVQDTYEDTLGSFYLGARLYRLSARWPSRHRGQYA